MSSDILSRPIDAGKFALIYAGAQKNLGPSGVTVVLLRESWLAQANKKRADDAALRDARQEQLALQHAADVRRLRAEPGAPVDREARRPAGDGRAQRPQGRASTTPSTEAAASIAATPSRESRSRMNVTFRLPSEALEKQFVAEAQAAGMVGLAGHRSVGGIRASIYNAISPEACQTLASFMDEFAKRNG